MKYTIQNKKVVKYNGQNTNLIFETLKEASKYKKATNGEIIKNSTTKRYPNYSIIEEYKNEYLKLNKLKEKHIKALEKYKHILREDNPINIKLKELNKELFQLEMDLSPYKKTIFRERLFSLYAVKKERITKFSNRPLRIFFGANEILRRKKTYIFLETKEQTDAYKEKVKDIESEMRPLVFKYVEKAEEVLFIKKYIKEQLGFYYEDYYRLKKIEYCQNKLLINITAQMKYNNHFFGSYHLEKKNLSELQGSSLIFDEKNNPNLLYLYDNHFVPIVDIVYRDGFPFFVGTDGASVSGNATIYVDNRIQGEPVFPTVKDIYDGPGEYKAQILYELEKNKII